LVLEVHDGHGYSTFNTALPTTTILFGRESVGVYFSADWCPSCVNFTPLLHRYYKTRLAGHLVNNDCSPFQIVLVLQCRSGQDTREFIEPMPWAALPHLKSMGERGQSLMTRFGITTIPALVFLDGRGKLTCLDGRQKIAADPTARASALVDDLPPNPQVGPQQAGRPSGDPTTFGRERPAPGKTPQRRARTCLLRKRPGNGAQHSRPTSHRWPNWMR
jgi:hypothetical protein